jgi:biotin carboxylase
MALTNLKRLLVANRGEIACRVMNSARALGLDTVAVHSEADARAKHVKFADEAVQVGSGSAAATSYLDADAVLAAARATGADCIHPVPTGVSKHSSVARRWRLGAARRWRTRLPRERNRENRKQKNKHRATASSPRTRPSRGAAPRKASPSWAPRPRRSTPWATRSSRSASRRRPA